MKRREGGGGGVFIFSFFLSVLFYLLPKLTLSIICFRKFLSIWYAEREREREREREWMGNINVVALFRQFLFLSLKLIQGARIQWSRLGVMVVIFIWINLVHFVSDFLRGSLFFHPFLSLSPSAFPKVGIVFSVPLSIFQFIYFALFNSLQCHCVLVILIFCG